MKRIIVLLVFLFILSGCVNGDRYRYNFSGSSENWDVLYIVDVSDGTNQVKNGIVKYIGEGDSPDTIEYKLESNSGTAEDTGIIIEHGNGNIANIECTGCKVIQKDEEIKVAISWNGQTENLILTIDK